MLIWTVRMSIKLSVKYLVENLAKDFNLKWLAGASAAEHLISRDEESNYRPTLIGTLNLISSNRIQVLGISELNSLKQHNLSANSEAMKQLFQSECNIIIITEDQVPPKIFTQLCNKYHIAMVACSATSHRIVSELRHRLTRYLAAKLSIHGVMMDVQGIGVFITGESGVGKSELALELISRGHALVADDSAEFRKIAPDVIECRCPELLEDFLEVRGLGVLNIRRMYGHASTRHRKILRYIIHLVPIIDGQHAIIEDRLEPHHKTRNILGIDFMQGTIPVAPGRNLAVIVEAAVRNHMLISEGYIATEDIIAKQYKIMERNSCD